MAKTKEEILLKRVEPDLYKHIMNAMDSYAKQEAIEFAGWVVNEGYEVHTIDAWMKINDTGSAPILNRNQLYQLFINSKK